MVQEDLYAELHTKAFWLKRPWGFREELRKANFQLVEEREQEEKLSTYSAIEEQDMGGGKTSTNGETFCYAHKKSRCFYWEMKLPPIDDFLFEKDEIAHPCVL
jgi:hypothetical protein